MHAKLTHPLAETAASATAEAVLRACVHCGMCNAVCPTYQLAGDERDGPRGRIYLMKGALEGEPVGRATQRHLDRCLSCRACESACPSGVQYHRLLDVGREQVDARVGRPWIERLQRAAVRQLAQRPALLGTFLRMSGRTRPSPSVPARAGGAPASRRMTLLKGCVQAGAAPHFNAATRRVFGRIGVDLAEAGEVGCCGALDFHLAAPEAARARARRNIEAWTAALDAGAEAIVVNASGCAAFIRDYPDILAGEGDIAARARRVAAAVRDPVEVLETAGLSAAGTPPRRRVAVHDPCTLVNGPGLGGRVAALLETLGYQPLAIADSPRCCGSGGAWSLFNPTWAKELRTRKIAALCAGAPDQIVTANVGCWLHLGAASAAPVRHWIEAVDEATGGAAPALPKAARTW